MLEQALSLTQSSRKAFLVELTERDPDLGADLSRLLANSESDPEWLARGAAISVDMLDAIASAQQGTQIVGQQVGPFAIDQEIGQGGMAQVFLAHRNDGLFDQQVALKMMWQGMLRGDLLNRFERERQILANLNDPHIASLLDGGVTGDGRPWLAMEYVAGEPIDEHCHSHQLTLEQRLTLLEDVAAAVSAAHRREIIHRDIKPSNVMVDQAGQVKLVDFGIAKLMGDGPDAATVTEARLLTPEYASPEQLEGLPLGRESDVYQLGLLLFELVTGRRPFQRNGDSPLTFQRKIVESPPPRPSETASRANAAGIKVDRDLDAIILKCLEKSPKDRYRTVEDLILDLRNYQQGLPLIAHAGLRWHRIRKFVARHRVGVSVTAAFAMMLLAYALTVTWQSARIVQERDMAQLEAAKAQEISAFLQELFSNASPDISLGKTLTIKEMVDQGSAQLTNRLNDQPLLKASMLDNLGGIYFSLGEYPAAVDHYQRSLTLREALNSSTEELSDSLLNLGSAQRGAGNFESALENLNKAATLRLTTGAPDSLALASIYSELGIAHSELGEDERSGEYHGQALNLRLNTLVSDDVDLALSKADYGVVLHRQKRRQEAGQLYREAITVQEDKLGPTHPRTLTTLRNLAALEIGLDNLPEAERLLKEVLQREQTIYGGDHPKMGWTLGYLGKVAADQNNLSRAQAHWREAVRVLSATLSGDHLHTAGANQELAKVLLLDGQTDEACDRLASTLEVRLSQRGTEAQSTNQSRFHLGRCRAAQQRLVEARQLFSDAQPFLTQTVDAEALSEALAALPALQ